MLSGKDKCGVVREEETIHAVEKQQLIWCAIAFAVLTTVRDCFAGPGVGVVIKCALIPDVHGFLVGQDPPRLEENCNGDFRSRPPKRAGWLAG